ncbi:MAG TPA: histidine phosphatase family protein [Chloroflexota bacterium]
MPPSTLLYVRHADVHNPANVIYGRLPRFGLSEKGWQQAEATARALAEEPITHIYTSPLLRARQTALVIARRHPLARLHVSRFLLEVKTAWQGTPNDGLGPGFSFYDPLKAPDDESPSDVADRMERFVRLLLRRHPGETVVCVSHGDPIKALRQRLEGRPVTVQSLREPDPAKGSITRFVFDSPSGPPRITYVDPSAEPAAAAATS